MQKISYPDDSKGNFFSSNVDISNDYCVIGIDLADSSGYAGGGAAYIYKYNSIENEWNYTQTLHPNDTKTEGHCGISVSIFENSIIIGCYGINKAYIYKLNETNSTWYQLSTLTAIGGTGPNDFGWSVDITDDYAIVGDFFNDDQGGNAGSSYIFIQTFNESTGQESWIYNQTLYGNDTTPGDLFGISVSISYDYAIVGAYGDDDNGDYSGSAYIFKLNKTTMIWEQMIKLIASDGTNDDLFGLSVSIDGIYGLAIVGAYGKNNSIGASYIFQRDNDSGIWNEMVILNPKNTGVNQNFGYSVSIYGESCIIGAPQANNNTGAAYEYKLKWNETANTTTWQIISHFASLVAHDDLSVAIFGDFVVIGSGAADGGYIYAGIEPSFSPTVAPSNQPTITLSPSFMIMQSFSSTIDPFNNFNVTEILVILFNSSLTQYNAISLANNNLLQNNITSLLQQQSQSEIENNNDKNNHVIVIEIEKIWAYNGSIIDNCQLKNGIDNVKNEYSELYYLSWILFQVKFVDSDKKDDWLKELDFIMRIFENELKEWEYFINDTISIDYCHVDSSSIEANGSKHNDLEIFSIILTIGMLSLFILISLFGCIDAKFVRRNEFFSIGAIMSAATCILDVVSGMYALLYLVYVPDYNLYIVCILFLFFHLLLCVDVSVLIC